MLGGTVFDARGRDLRTEPDGSATVLASARLTGEVGSFPALTLERLGADPPDPALDGLVGRSVASGFRAAAAAALPAERARHGIRHQLLDDLPTALLVSGYAFQRAGALRAGSAEAAGLDPPTRPQRPGARPRQYPDLCAGWVTGGTILSRMDERGIPPTPFGPPAPPLHRDDDPLAWHDTEALPPHGMRRWRRLDVWREGGLAAVECLFRDSHMDEWGSETVVHEYTVRATVDPAAGTFVSCEADIGALPWPECPGAVASAGRLAGLPVVGIRQAVRDTFVGPTTCTHLNDTLRALEDVAGLITALPPAAGG